jgi:regulator of sigma E protease
MILFTWGDSYIPVQKATMGMQFNETAKSIGFRDGDILLSADGEELVRYDGDMLRKVVDAREVTVLRGNEKVSVYIPEEMMQKLMTDSVKFAYYRFPFVIDSIVAASPAQLAGLQKGDSIVALNGTPVAYYDFMNQMDSLRKNKASLQADSLDPHQLTIAYYRAGVADTISLKADSTYKIGVTAQSDLTKLLPSVDVKYGFFESFPAGVALGVKTLKGYVGDMKYLFSKEGAKQLGGFGTIGSIFPATWDWHQFWYMTAFLSIILAFMNILPIPLWMADTCFSCCMKSLPDVNLAINLWSMHKWWVWSFVWLAYLG